MNFKKLEKEVKENSSQLDEKIKNLIKKQKDKYAVYNNGNVYFADSFKEGVNTGIKEFGEETGFVVKKVTKENHIILSSLVTL